MNPAHSLIPIAFALVSPAFAAQAAAIADDPQFTVVLQPAAIEFQVRHEPSPFLGIVLVSLSPDLQHFHVGLPPLLEQSAVLGWGIGQDGEFATRVPDVMLPPGVMIYAQGVTISELGIRSSEVAAFVLDATGTSGS